ncbi:MAG: co-chaperone YbbN, partial [Pirellulaceae bacterium]|nr:co-chaperone YbbN [Pirellulaceae bacterium]
MTNADWIRHTTDDTFETEVVERSRQGLVVLDFWAEWCGPCRALAPTLEKLALEYAGRFTLVKANTDETPEAAGKYSVASIPTVLGIMDGEIVDAFEGALPERQIRH